jgi:hypothetical protein
MATQMKRIAVTSRDAGRGLWLERIFVEAIWHSLVSCCSYFYVLSSHYKFWLAQTLIFYPVSLTDSPDVAFASVRSTSRNTQRQERHAIVTGSGTRARPRVFSPLPHGVFQDYATHFDGSDDPPDPLLDALDNLDISDINEVHWLLLDFHRSRLPGSEPGAQAHPELSTDERAGHVSGLSYSYHTATTSRTRADDRHQLLQPAATVGLNHCYRQENHVPNPNFSESDADSIQRCGPLVGNL